MVISNMSIKQPGRIKFRIKISFVSFWLNILCLPEMLIILESLNWLLRLYCIRSWLKITVIAMVSKAKIYNRLNFLNVIVSMDSLMPFFISNRITPQEPLLSIQDLRYYSLFSKLLDVLCQTFYSKFLE